MKPSAFTVLHNDVLEGRWRRSNEAWAQNTESALSLRSLEGNSAASYLTLCDWNTSSTRLQCEVWWYLYLCLCQRNMGTERGKTLTPFEHEDMCLCLRLWLHPMHLCGVYVCVFLQQRQYHSLPLYGFHRASHHTPIQGYLDQWWPQMLFTISSQKSSVLNMLFAQSGLVPRLYC